MTWGVLATCACVACLMTARDAGADPETLLERAQDLAGSETTAGQREAESLLSQALAQDPGNAQARLLRAQVRSWIGMYDESAADYRALLAVKPDAALELELATALSWSSQPRHLAESIERFDRYLAAHPGDHAAALARARVLLWTDALPAAERALDQLVAHAPAQRAEARLERARLYAQSERELLALAELGDLSLADARTERRKIASQLGPRVTPAIVAHGEAAGVRSIASTVEGQAVLGSRTLAFARAGRIYATAPMQAAEAQLADVGARIALGRAIVDASLGGRDLDGTAGLAGKLAAAGKLAPWLAASAEVGRDYLYEATSLPATITARTHGLYVRPHTTATLAHGVTAELEGLGRWLADGNTALAATGSATIRAFGPVRAGYRGHVEHWDMASSNYYSPALHQTHAVVAELWREFAHPHVEVSAELGAGVATERGTAPGPMVSGELELRYHASEGVELTAAASYLRTRPRQAESTPYWQSFVTLGARFAL